jgi:hypothetical protein
MPVRAGRDSARNCARMGAIASIDSPSLPYPASSVCGCLLLTKQQPGVAQFVGLPLTGA